MGALVFFLLQNLGRAHHLARTVRERGLPMASERGSRQLQLLLNLRPRKRLKTLHDLAGRWICGRYRHADFLSFAECRGRVISRTVEGRASRPSSRAGTSRAPCGRPTILSDRRLRRNSNLEMPRLNRLREKAVVDAQRQKSVRETFSRPSGTRVSPPLFPALKRRAIGRRPSGAGFCAWFHQTFRKRVLTHTIKGCLILKNCGIAKAIP